MGLSLSFTVKQNERAKFLSFPQGFEKACGKGIREMAEAALHLLATLKLSQIFILAFFEASFFYFFRSLSDQDRYFDRK